MHVGTFTPEGTWRRAMAELPGLAELGITVVEMMPIAEFAGGYGWGYDGVDLYAPSHLYGTPDDLRRFVDRAHQLGLAVILDVVFNHFGPDGNYLRSFSERYFSRRYTNEWGDAINFDDQATAVREFMIANAAYWIDEFHMDGLRFDATQQIFDTSPVHVLAAMSQHARGAAPDRSLILVAENEPQDVRGLRPIEQGGFGFDALWNDDFHHAAMVLLTGRRAAYYTDYRGTPQEFISLAKRGFLYQGQRYAWQRKPRGTPTAGVGRSRFITFLQNHDQIANAPSGRGERVHTIANAALYRAMTAYWLLSPGTPLFFQGQEFAASAPFLYFSDHSGELGSAVRRGRADFMSQFHGGDARHLVETLPDPNDRATYLRSKLDPSERTSHTHAVSLHRDLLRLRREDAVLQRINEIAFDGAVLSERAFVLRYFSIDAEVPRPPVQSEDDRLLVVNLGTDLHLTPAPEPLLAPLPGARWEILWSSEDPAYGGAGTQPLDTDEGWRIPGHASVLLAPRGS
jgi:maltooligosyltrehalose trehalohydrolase